MKMQDRYEVKKASGKSIKVSVPGSKSITNRALLLAALAPVSYTHLRAHET